MLHCVYAPPCLCFAASNFHCGFCANVPVCLLRLCSTTFTLHHVYVPLSCRFMYVPLSCRFMYVPLSCRFMYVPLSSRFMYISLSSRFGSRFMFFCVYVPRGVCFNGSLFHRVCDPVLESIVFIINRAMFCCGRSFTVFRNGLCLSVRPSARLCVSVFASLCLTVCLSVCLSPLLSLCPCKCVCMCVGVSECFNFIAPQNLCSTVSAFYNACLVYVQRSYVPPCKVDIFIYTTNCTIVSQCLCYPVPLKQSTASLN